jgi:hypothetical protein
MVYQSPAGGENIMGIRFCTISEGRPYFSEILAYIRQSSEPVFRKNIHKDLPHIPDLHLNRDLRFAFQNGFCQQQRVKDPNRSQSIVSYGPLTSRGQRYLVKMPPYIEAAEAVS